MFSILHTLHNIKIIAHGVEAAEERKKERKKWQRTINQQEDYLNNERYKLTLEQ